MHTAKPIQPVTPPRRRPAPTTPQPMTLKELADKHARRWRIPAPREPGQEG